MFKRLFKKTPVKVWVIKQIDRDLLHLCGQAELDHDASRKQVLAELARGEYRGPVRMAGGGLVFNARLFAALIPLDKLMLSDDGQACWQGRGWRVSQVPQRCWGFEGPLIAEPASHLGDSGLISSEDVSGLRSRIDPDTPTPPGGSPSGPTTSSKHPTRSTRSTCATLPDHPNIAGGIISHPRTDATASDTQAPDTRRLALFVGLMVLVGLNLRPALSTLAPLLARIQLDTGLSALAIGALTTLPVLCLGIFAPLAPWLAKRFGPENTLAAALLLLTAGLLLRGVPAVIALFGGTLMVGAAIGVAGTLLPALVKRELPAGADLMTGVYTMALCLGGALGAGLSVPLADRLGNWSTGLASWALLAVAALMAWQLLMPRHDAATTATAGGGSLRALLSQPLAWQVMLFMGSQSSLAYIVFGWLPTLLMARGYSEAEAGWMMGASVMVQLLSALSAPWLARLGRDQRPALLIVLAMVASGFWLLLQAPAAWRWPGAVLLGLGQGGGFSLALTLIVLRTATSRLAGKLSGLVQGGGYTLAALGPLAVGVMLQFDVGLAVLTRVLLGIVVVSMGFALFAGRNRRLEVDDAGRLRTR